MGFLFKSLFFLGLVALLIVRDTERRPAAVERLAPAPRPVATAKSKAPPLDSARNALSELAEEAVDRIAGAARDHCLAHPADCLRAAEQIGRATGIEPPRRPAGLGAAP